MTGRRWSQATQDALAAGRERAKERRDAGGSTVRVYRTAAEMYARIGKVDCDCFDVWLLEVRERVADAVESLRNDTLRAREGLRDDDEIPF